MHNTRISCCLSGIIVYLAFPLYEISERKKIYIFSNLQTSPFKYGLNIIFFYCLHFILESTTELNFIL